MAAKAKTEADTFDDDMVDLDLPAKPPSKAKSGRRDKDPPAASKRRCVSTACIACRRRKSKCDGNTPSCAACASVYGTECVYDPSSDNRRKGVYKKTIDSLRTRNSTLQTLIQAILNSSEDEVIDLVREIRSCESLDDVAESLITNGVGLEGNDEETDTPFDDAASPVAPTFEAELSGKMGELRLEDGSVRFIGGTSNLRSLGPGFSESDLLGPVSDLEQRQQQLQPITSWTDVTPDSRLILHLLNMYFTWHYPYFTTLSRTLFYKDFSLGKPPDDRRSATYCSPLLVNAMLALGCHFTSIIGARAIEADPSTAGDHFFKEAKRLILQNDEHEKPRLTTVQALGLMSVREAGCGREAKGWVYSGMSFRMALDIGLNLDSGALAANKDLSLDEQLIDARRITFWGCFLFDKCWSNYLGRLPQLPSSTVTVPKIDVFPTEDAAIWAPYSDAGRGQAHSQPSRTRAVALQISYLCEISSDLLIFFYDPTHLDKPVSRSTELKKLSELHRRLEAWKKNLPHELEAKEGALPSVLVMHMFYQLLFIHLFRPLLKYHQSTSPLPPHVSPRRQCTQAATSISKLIRLYKRSYGLRQICNIAVYIAHSACTIHLLNLPEKIAKRDIIYGVRHLEEIAAGWPCASRTLHILNSLAQRWKISLPDEAADVLMRNDLAYSPLSREDSSSPRFATTAVRRSVDLAPPATDSEARTSPLTATHLTPHRPDYAMGASHRRTGRQAVSTTDIPMDLTTPTPTQPLYSTVDHIAPAPPASAVQAPATPAPLPISSSGSYGPTSGLVQESQDWWYKDQSAFAIRFESWHGTESDQAVADPVGGLGFTSLNAPTLDSSGEAEWYA